MPVHNPSITPTEGTLLTSSQQFCNLDPFSFRQISSVGVAYIGYILKEVSSYQIFREWTEKPISLFSSALDTRRLSVLSCIFFSFASPCNPSPHHVLLYWWTEKQKFVAVWTCFLKYLRDTNGHKPENFGLRVCKKQKNKKPHAHLPLSKLKKTYVEDDLLRELIKYRIECNKTNAEKG